MRESYKRFVKTWIRFANPWIRFVSWSWILDSYRIVDHKSWLKKIRFESLVTNPVNFQRFACFYESYESYESLQILSSIAQNKSLKIEICKSKSLQILKLWTRESGFANPNLKDLYRGFISWICFWKIRFVDSFCANKNLKLLDSFRFVRIRIQIPHPY
jgi:hypothetical protein